MIKPVTRSAMSGLKQAIANRNTTRQAGRAISTTTGPREFRDLQRGVRRAARRKSGRLDFDA